MYVIKNAFRCIGRAKGRNILIGIIALVIAISACIGLSIRQAAVSAKENAAESLTVTATISFDRQSMMQNMAPPMQGEGQAEGGFDKDAFTEKMGEFSSLTLEEYQSYAEIETVKDFYYSTTVSVDGSEEFLPVSTETESEDTSDQTQQENSPFGQSGMSGMPMGGRFEQSDFQVIGYSSDSAIESLVNGTAKTTDGRVFEQGTTEAECMISSELATYNDLAVGDAVTVTNPNNEEETFDLTVVGIYTDQTTNESSFSMGFPGAGTDPVNQIYMSYAALAKIVDATEATDEETALQSSLEATYVFADPDGYYTFETKVKEMGLDDSYTVSSADVSSYEEGLVPLETLSTMAGWFLLVILAIGGVILVVLNIFNVRERKYEIGVLTAMGMRKGKVATQFMVEIFAITMIAVIIGVGIGGVCAVPVTNVLLENQVEASKQEAEQVEQNFNRPTDIPTMPGGDFGGGFGGGNPFGGQGGGQTQPDGAQFEGIEKMFGERTADYITQVDSAMDLTVVLQMLGIALLLTLLSGMVSTLFIMRYEPLKILANRD